MSKAEDLYLKSPLWLQKAMVAAYGYKLYRRRYTGIYRDILGQLEKSHSWSRGEVEAYQNEQLHEIVKYSFSQIPYYADLASEHSLTAGDITSFADLAKLPVLDKHTLRTNAGRFTPRTGEKPYAITHTSGSTGTPLFVHNDEYTYKLAMALLVDLEKRNGVQFGERRASFAGRMIQATDNQKPPYWRFNRAENQLLFSVYHLNDNSFRLYADTLDDFAPRELIGHPSSLANLSDHYIRFNRKPGFSPQLVVTNSENLLEWQREKIENVFQCPVKDYYCTAEYVIFAAESADGIYETNPLLGMAEFEPIPGDDETCNLLTTTLTNRAMPLLRYRIGDTATPADDKQKHYGAPRIRNIEGRIDDYLETADGRKIGRVSQALKGIAGIKEAQFVQRQPGKATINVVSDGTGRHREEVIIRQAKHWLGTDFDISINLCDEIPRGRNGKFKFVLRSREDTSNSASHGNP